VWGICVCAWDALPALALLEFTAAEKAAPTAAASAAVDDEEEEENI